MEERIFATTFVAVFTSLTILAMQYSEQSASRNHSKLSLAPVQSTVAHVAVKAPRSDWTDRN